MDCQKFPLFLIFFLVQIAILMLAYYTRHTKINISKIDSKQEFTRSSLLQIGMKHHTDKIHAHHYESLYEKYLSHYRDTSIRLLEIGLGCGMSPIGASAETWREYLGSEADIHFIEIDEKCGKNWETTMGSQLNVTVHYGSQEDVTFLEKLKSYMQQFDVIIDDGGHTMNQQKTSFITLLSLVRSGGLYVIEDLETSYMPNYGGKYLDPSTTIEFIKTFVDEMQAVSPKVFPFARNVSSFEVGDGICFFTIK